jgi:hypothetical protein
MTSIACSASGTRWSLASSSLYCSRSFMRAAGTCQTGVYGSRSSNSAHGVVIKVPGRSEVSASSRRASLVTGDAGVVSARRRDCSALFEIGNSRLSPLFDRLHCLLHGGGRIILGASRCNSVDENCRYALPDPPRRLNRGTILDLTQHRKDVGCGDTLDRRCAKIRKHVSLQGMQHIVGVLFDPMPPGSSHAIRGRRLPMRPPLDNVGGCDRRVLLRLRRDLVAASPMTGLRRLC